MPTMPTATQPQTTQMPTATRPQPTTPTQPQTQTQMQTSKRSRRHRQPRRDPAFAQHTLAQVRTIRQCLTDEEARVSYWRRILQARIDMLLSSDRPGADLDRLAHVLRDSRGSHRRVTALSLDSVAQLPPLPDLVALWHRVTPTDDTARRAYLADLQAAETRLSEYRHRLHDLIDQATDELIARYHDDPSLALVALRERLPRERVTQLP